MAIMITENNRSLHQHLNLHFKIMLRHLMSITIELTIHVIKVILTCIPVFESNRVQLYSGQVEPGPAILRRGRAGCNHARIKEKVTHAGH
jgi:hypothetical protein